MDFIDPSLELYHKVQEESPSTHVIAPRPKSPASSTAYRPCLADRPPRRLALIALASRNYSS